MYAAAAADVLHFQIASQVARLLLTNNLPDLKLHLNMLSTGALSLS